MKEYPWFEHYPEGIPREIDPDVYRNITHLLEESFAKYPDSIAFENMGGTLTYAELNKLSADFAGYLQHVAKLKPGDRIAIQLPNLLQFPVAMFGAMRAGLIVVNTNPLYTPTEMQHQFKDSGAKAIVILDNFAHNLEKVLKNTGIKTVIVARIGDLLGTVKGAIVNFVVKYIKKMVPAYSLPSAISFKDALKAGANHTYKPHDADRNDVAFLQYTGGTTGLSKGASLTHRNILANMTQISAWAGDLYEENKEIIITALPLYHIFALTVNCLSIMAIGGMNVLVTNPRDMPKFIKTMKSFPFTAFTGVNTLFNGLMNQPEFNSIDFSNLKLTLGGGMAVQDVVATRWEKLTGSPLLEAYGLSETAPGLTANPANGKHRLGFIGLPIPSTEVILVDEEGNLVPQGERGEIAAKGPQVMKGYWEKPEETANVMLEGGWFKTGDIAVMDKDGFFKIVDRKKDMILVSGFNVYPNEVENVVAAHPKVLEVGCIGVPDEKSTEAVKIVVVKKDESLTEEELKAYCRENLTGYKIPKHIAWSDDLPKSNVGKVIRRLLR